MLSFTRVNGRLFELEAFRGLAAIYVVLHHTLKDAAAAVHPLLGTALSFGQEAVVIFFVLSGFVVHYSTVSASSPSWRRYAWARFLRIEPIYLLALVAAFAARSVALGSVVAIDGWQLLGNLAFLQDLDRPGTIVTPFSDNLPLWSLSYEIFFYVAYPLVVRYVSEDVRHRVVGGVSVLSLVLLVLFPNQLFRWIGYFIIWWTGVVLADCYAGRASYRRLAETILALAVGAFIWVGVAVLGHYPVNGTTLGVYPILEARHFVAAIAFTGLVTLWSLANWVGFRWTIGPFAILAPISYGIYLLHFPIMNTISARTEWLGLVQWPVMFCVTLALAWLSERRLQPWIRESSRSWRSRSRKMQDGR
ncbi:acyltransferase family protein [Devosia sp.]|uniref:acyltransferase family protein n=1 Tax=Devosia sp. TaxID=1871048 RepID=UPI003BA928A1